MSRNNLKEILSEIYVGVRHIIDNGVSDIILYGSYARGDFDNESDIDIAVIVDNDRLDLKKYRKDIVSPYELFKHGIRCSNQHNMHSTFRLFRV